MNKKKKVDMGRDSKLGPYCIIPNRYRKQLDVNDCKNLLLFFNVLILMKHYTILIYFNFKDTGIYSEKTLYRVRLNKSITSTVPTIEMGKLPVECLHHCSLCFIIITCK